MGRVAVNLTDADVALYMGFLVAGGLLGILAGWMDQFVAHIRR